MIGQLSRQWRFLLEWTIFNIIGFMLGSFLGATDGGVVPAALGGGLAAKVAGDALFGAAFGLSQVIVFWRHFPQSRGRLWVWVVASMIGFTLGARLGARFAYVIAPEEPGIAIVFGIIIGGCLGMLEWAAIRWADVLKVETASAWLPASILAWIIGEIIAFSSDFSQTTVPLVAISIALVTGVALVLWIRPR